MLDGRIDTQGTVASLREQGVLESIAHSEEVQAIQEEKKVEEESGENVQDSVDAVEAVDGEEGDDQGKKAKKPRKLVKDEQRLTGGVKWPIYKTYLKAS